MDWPFTVAELTAGLRRYFTEPALRVKTITVTPARATASLCAIRGLVVGYELAGESFSINCVVKEPRGAGRPGLAHPGVREAGIYRSLASQLPMPTPALIAADPAGSWLVLEAVESAADLVDWQSETYAQAVSLLARLHERFWDLAEDLSAYRWLARPLTLDYEIHVQAAAQALGKIVRAEQPALIARSAAAVSVLGRLVSQADRVVEPLRAGPFTLLHGDYWEGNILRDEDGDMVVLDWQLAAIGPGVLDLVVLVTNSLWHHDCLPCEQTALTALYREEIGRWLKVRWTEAEWARLWDHALLWRFLQETLSWAASVGPDTFAATAERFEAVWLKPVLEAAGRRLAPMPSGW